MGLLDFLKGKQEPASAENESTVTLGAPAKGTFLPMQEIPDEVFSSGVLGKCCGVDPDEGKVYAPVDGTITQLAETLHAVGMEADGVELLLHIGVDTVEMKGDGFESKVRLNQTVKKGELLLTMDLEKIRKAGHPASVIMAVTNSDEFSLVEEVASGIVLPETDILKIHK